MFTDWWLYPTKRVEPLKVSDKSVTSKRVDVMLASITLIKNEILSETESDWVSTTMQDIRFELAKKAEKALLELRNAY
jgi:hypothetical protein